MEEAPGEEPVEWESFPRLPGRRLRWHRYGPRIRSISLVDHQTGKTVVSLRTRRSVLTGFGVGPENYGVRSTDDGYRLINEDTGMTIFSVRGRHTANSAGTEVTLPGGATVTFPVSGPNRRRAVLRAVRDDDVALFHLRWVRGSFWGGVTGLEVVVAPDLLPTAELLGMIYLTSTALFANFFRLYVPIFYG